MDPMITSALISGGSNILGGLLGGGGGGSAKRFRNRQQDFAEDAFLRQTEHRVDDMKRAGINPIMAVGGGVHPGSPTQAPNSDNPSSAKQAQTAKQQLALNAARTLAEIKNLNANTDLTNEKTDTQDNITAASNLPAEMTETLLNLLGGKGATANSAKDLRETVKNIPENLRSTKRKNDHMFKYNRTQQAIKNALRTQNMKP